ncbi:hypothetical protein FJZ31_07380 [Candidatus Poribacteria bacterium]|nr:hypothetical protein [Candidatus Poribacteria bacterium]
MIKYLLDEHIPHAYRDQLLYHEPSLTILVIGGEGAPCRGTPDPEILRWCEQNGFILLTNNRKTMPTHLADHLSNGRHVPGILIIDLEARMGLVLEDLILSVKAARESEFMDCIAYVPL